MPSPATKGRDKLFPEPDIKIATRSVFYDETGKRVRTKKEVFDKNSVYLPTKKIGKNDPKAAEIGADNTTPESAAAAC